jgi:3-methyladenine DNA glycosylase AlkD
MAADPTRLTIEQIIDRLESLANPERIAGMASFGIHGSRMLGISMPNLRAIAKGQRDHGLALQLWETEIHEARILATLIDDPRSVTPEQMDCWTADFDSWDLCDQACINLYCRTPYAVEKVQAWAGREEEFVRRAAFALIAALAVHDKKAPDEQFLAFLPLIKQHSTDSRNFVRKAVNWALRQIGKRSIPLRLAAIETARQIEVIPSGTARWIAADALKELEAKY